MYNDFVMCDEKDILEFEETQKLDEKWEKRGCLLASIPAGCIIMIIGGPFFIASTLFIVLPIWLLWFCGKLLINKFKKS